MILAFLSFVSYHNSSQIIMNSLITFDCRRGFSWHLKHHSMYLISDLILSEVCIRYAIFILCLISKLFHLIPSSCNLDSTNYFPRIFAPPLLKFSTFFTHPLICTPVYLFARLPEYISRQNSLHKIDIGYRTFFLKFTKSYLDV